MSFETNYAMWMKYNCRESLSLLGWALFAIMVVGSVVQWVAIFAVALISPDLLEDSVVLWLLTALPSYFVGMPVGIVMMKSQKVIAPPIPKKPLSLKSFAKVLVIAFAALYVGNFITLGITELIGSIRGTPVSNPVEALDDFPLALSILLTCVMAPVMEEFIFRGLLLQRLRPYGDVVAILTSALCFGIFHATLNQLLYAFAVGVVFAYVALRTGNIWQTMMLHGLINSVSTVVIPILVAWGETGELILSAFVILSLAVGITLFFRSRPQWHFNQSEVPFTLSERLSLFWLSGGGVFFTLVSVLTMVVTLVAE